MNAGILIIEMLIIAAAFSIMVISMENKAVKNRNFDSLVADYPTDIQETYYRSQGKKAEKEKLTAKNYVAKAVFMAVALAVVIALAALAGARTFWQGFLAAVIYTLGIFAVDTFVIDWIVFPRIKKWRLPGTETMDKEYAQKWFHVKACFPMIPVFLVFAILAGIVIMLIYRPTA